MKRRAVKFLFAALMLLTLSMTACGGSDNAARSEDVETQETASTEEETPAEEEAPVEEAPAEEEASAEEETPAEEETAVEDEAAAGETDSGSMTLEEFLIEDPETEKLLKEQIASVGNDQVDLSIEVKGNELIYIGTFKDSVELVENAAEGLQGTLDANAEIYASRAGLLDQILGAETGTVTFSVKYCDSDGNVLAEASYKAE